MNSITKGGEIKFAILMFLFVAAAAQSATYYVDSVNGRDSYSGTSTSAAWQTLTKVNSTTLAAGDSLLFKRGCSWTGQCWPKGSGTSASVIKIGTYGSVGSGNAVINGPGGTTRAAFMLYNQEYIEVNDLEITHHAGSHAEIYRLGVMVQTEQSNFTADHIYLRNLEVHNVDGNSASKNTGGIFFVCSGDGASGTKSQFNDILIENCNIYDVNRTGLSFLSDWMTRTSSDDSTWAGWTNVIVRNNTFENTYSNGVICRQGISPLVEYNVFQNCGDGEDSGNALFTFACNDAICQYNEGYGTVYNAGDADAAAFDSDYQCKNTIYQYNYSHDNGMGAFVAVSDGSTGKFNINTIYRYNICQNNLRQTFRSSGDTCTNTKIYNNVFYLGTGLSDNLIVYLKSWNGYPDGVIFNNNIIYNLSSNASYNFGSATGVSFDYNVFYGNHPGSEPSDAHKSTADPLLVSPGSGGTGLNTVDGYKIQSTSPCKDSGMTIASNGGKDYWGNTVPYNTTTDRGAHEYQGTPDTTPPTPNPMTWSSVPAATSSTTIAMTATTASDASGVSYFFDCTTAGGHDSAWQASTSYTDTGLTAGTSYTYQVKARDNSANLNETTFSTTKSATTNATDTTPPTPNPMTWATVPYAAGSTSIAMVATTASDTSGVSYFFDCTAGGGHDSAWQASASYTDTGLTANTAYTYQVKARDNSANLNETTFSTIKSATTSVSSTTIFTNGFEDCFSSWTAAVTPYCSTAVYYAGTHSSKHDATDYISKWISTVGYTSITVQYARNTSAYESGDSFVSEWYDGSTWTAIENMTSGFGGWTLTSNIALPAGAANNANFRFKIRVVSSASEFCYVDAVTIKGVAAATTDYQAEDATLSGPIVATTNAGYTGTGYADYQNASDDYIEWTVNAPAAGTYTLQFRYALLSGDRPLELKVNGTIVEASKSFPATGAWTTWSTVSKSVSLNSGSNTVRLTSIGSNGGNIDKLTVIP